MIDTTHVITIVLAVLQGLVGMVLYFLKTSLAEIKGGLHEAQEKHTKLLEQLPREYVLREEYMRVMASLESKLDRVLAKLDGHITRESEGSYGRIPRGIREGGEG